MDSFLEQTVWQRMERTAKALEQNNMKGYCVKTRADVIPLLKELIAENATVEVGGSVSLDECGVLDFLRSGPYQYWDRYEPLKKNKALLEKLNNALAAIKADGTYQKINDQWFPQ